MYICSEPECSKPRGGRNIRCWMHLKRAVRRNQAYRAFQEQRILDADLDLVLERDLLSGQEVSQDMV